MEYKCAKQANEVDSSVGAIGKKTLLLWMWRIKYREEKRYK